MCTLKNTTYISYIETKIDTKEETFVPFKINYFELIYPVCLMQNVLLYVGGFLCFIVPKYIKMGKLLFSYTEIKTKYDFNIIVIEAYVDYFMLFILNSAYSALRSSPT